MSSHEYLRELINDRLSAAAAEIFGAFKNVIIEYEEELYRQGRLLSVCRKPEIKLHRIELPLRQVRKKKEEVLTDPEQEDSDDNITDPEKEDTEEDHCDSEQEDSEDNITDPDKEDTEEDHSDPEQEDPEEDLTDPQQDDPEEDLTDPEQKDPETLQMKGKQNKRHTHQEGEQFVEKPEGNGRTEDETLSLNPDELLGEAQKECSVNRTTGDPNSDQPSNNSHVAKRRDQTGDTCGKDSKIPFKKKRKAKAAARAYVCQTCGKNVQTRREFSDHMGIHAKLLLQRIVKEKQSLTEQQQLCNQERDSAADKKGSESPSMKEQLGEFGAFQNIVECRGEVDRQRRILDVIKKLEIKLHRMKLPLQHVCREDKVLAEQHLCDHEWNSTLDQEDPKPPQMKEEQGELCTSQKEEELMMNEETDAFMLSLTQEEKDHQEHMVNPAELLSAAGKENAEGIISVVGATTTDQLLSHAAESRHQIGDTRGGDSKLKSKVCLTMNSEGL